MSDTTPLHGPPMTDERAHRSSADRAAFERMLADLSARFINIAGAQVDAEIANALRELIAFLGFERSTFAEVTREGKGHILCSVAVDGIVPLPLGPMPPFLRWYLGEILAGRVIVTHAADDFPPEAAEAAEHYRNSGLRSQLTVPLSVGGEIVGAIAFGAFRATRVLDADLIARTKLIGEVFAQALARKRADDALSKTETALSEALQIAELAYWEYDAGNAEFLLNDRYYSLHRAGGGDVGFYRVPTGRFLERFVHPEDAPRFAAYIDESLEPGRSDGLNQIEIQILCGDGTVRWLLVRCRVERGTTAEAVKLVGASQDTTERKRAEEALRSTQSELVRVTQLSTMGQMAASIAHEINQPLAAIVTNANAGLRWLAGETPNVEEARAVLRRIVGDGHRAAEVIGGIRAMFKNEGQEKVPLDVNRLIRETLALVKSDILRHAVAVETKLADGLPEVSANRAQLQQVILNLVANALDAMGSITDRARILRLRSERSGPGEVLITVEDSGPGIDPKNLDRIFEAFFTTKSHGMGMGWSISPVHHRRPWPGFGNGRRRRGWPFRLRYPADEAPVA